METEVVYGVHPVREVLRRGARRVLEVYVGRSRRDPAVKEILGLCRERGLSPRFADKQEVERLAPGGNHQGLAARVESLPVRTVEELIGATAIDERTIWVGLDGITDPHNLGAILRNAACFGAGAVIVTERRSAHLSPLVQKIASGAAEHVAVAEAVNLGTAIDRLRREGFWIYGAAVEGAPLTGVRFAGPALLLIGAEGVGLRRSTRNRVDELVAIPQAPGGIASLNASAASAVLLFEARRRLPTDGGVRGEAPR
jgi:23S rRNA (guanosine2251-2'-O)-methyltransferase